jgi:hypothetical protein
MLVQLSSCSGFAGIPNTRVPNTGVPNTGVPNTGGSQVIGTVSNVKTQVHSGARDDLKLVEGKAELGNDDFVSVTEGGKARLEFPGPISLLLFNQSDMDGIKLEYDANSNPRIVNRLIRGGFSGNVEPGNQLTVDLAFGVKVNVLGTRFFIIYDEANGIITIGKFDGTLTVSVPGKDTLILADFELVDVTSNGAIKRYSPFSFTPTQFELLADQCSSPIQGVNILRRNNGLPLPGEAVADRNQTLPCGSLMQPPVTVTVTPWIDLDYCVKSTEDICVNAFVLVQQGMMITLWIQRPNISKSYVVIDNQYQYPCKELSGSQSKYFCIGDRIRPNSYVLVQVFHRDSELLAQGYFLIGSLLAPTRTPHRSRYP